MEDRGLLRKDQLEISLHDEKRLIEEGVIKEDNPLDLSEDFRRLCEASRRGDMKTCQELIQSGVNINAKDQYDYTPLILASLCGHYETVELLLESGALCERDTFQGERCLYNALNDKIRNLLLSYDYSKSTDPLQPLASHLSSLLVKQQPPTSDLTVATAGQAFHLHKFVLAARSPYFAAKLHSAPDTLSWNLPSTIPPQAFDITVRHLYLGELPQPGDLGGGPGTGFTDSEVLAGIDKISKHLEIESLSTLILDSENRRIARQRRQDEVEFGRDQIEAWFRGNVIKHRVETDVAQAGQIRWDRSNGVFADVLLRADEESQDALEEDRTAHQPLESGTNILGLPHARSRSPSQARRPRRSVLYPCHKSMLIRSEFFQTMFDSPFREAQQTPYLQTISIDCSPAVLEIILTFLYTERADFGLDTAIDVLFVADMLFLEKLKARAAVVISSLGNGIASVMPTEVAREDDEIDIYEILRAAWTTRVQRLEEFSARYIAYRLEKYIDDPEFAELVKESAGRIQARQETDTIEILDDIRYYLSERFRLRFEDIGLEEAMNEEQDIIDAQNASLEIQSGGNVGIPVQRQMDELASSVVSKAPSDEGIDVSTPPSTSILRSISTTEPIPGTSSNSDNVDDAELVAQAQAGIVRTLDGEVAGDEFAADAINYQILLGKIDTLLENLKLDA